MLFVYIFYFLWFFGGVTFFFFFNEKKARKWQHAQMFHPDNSIIWNCEGCGWYQNEQLNTADICTNPLFHAFSKCAISCGWFFGCYFFGLFDRFSIIPRPILLVNLKRTQDSSFLLLLLLLLCPKRVPCVLTFLLSPLYYYLLYHYNYNYNQLSTHTFYQMLLRNPYMLEHHVSNYDMGRIHRTRSIESGMPRERVG